MPPKLPPRLQKFGPILAPLLATMVVCNAWFFSYGVRTAGDWGYFVKAASDTLRRHYFSIWLSDTQFGRVLIDAGQAPSYAVYGWLSYYLHTSYAVNERLVHLWPAAIVAVVSSYALVHYIFRDRMAAVLGAIVFSANTYYLALLTGGLTLAVAYAFAPLTLLFYMKAINRRKAIDVIACGLLLAICGAYEPRIAFIVVLVLAILAAVHFYFVWQPKNRLFTWATFKTMVIYSSPMVLFALLNLYWIMGLAQAGGAGGTGISSSLFGNEFFTISEALTLFHPYWTGGQIQPFFIHSIPLYFWLIPLAAVGGLAMSKRTPVVLFFAFIGILGVLLTKQSDQPFVGLYHWLFANVPGFNAFREASKFYLLTALAYAVLLPALYWYVKTQYRNKWLTAACFVGLSLLFLPNLLPIVTNKIGGTFRPRSIPAQYQQLNAFLDTPDYGRVLWVPQKSRWSYMSASHPAVGAAELVRTSWKDLTDSYQTVNNATPADEINSLLKQNYMPSLLTNAGIKYIIVPMRDIANDDNFYRNYNDDPALFAQTLARSNYAKEVPIHIDGIKVFQTVQQAKPYFSAAKQLHAITSDEQLPAAYDFWQKSIDSDKDFNFTLGDVSTQYTTGVHDLFGGIASNSLKKGTVPIAKTGNQKTASYYFDQSYSKTSYTADASSLSFQTTSLPAPGSSLTPKTTTTSWPLVPNTNYIVRSGTIIEPVVRSQPPTYLGSPREDTQLYAVDSSNLIPKPAINGSLWYKEPSNCVPYGSKASIRMVSSQDAVLDRPVMSLMADDHAACSGPPAIPVQAGERYLLHFAYRGFDAQFVGYRLSYNTPGHKSYAGDIPVSDNVWHRYDTVITVPSGANNVTIKLLGRPSNQLKANSITSYIDLSLVRLHQVTTFKTATGDIRPVDATLADLAKPYEGYKYENLIQNGSFESGLWKKQVGDCDAYDSNPALSMSLTNREASDGAHALQLEAKRHIACTNTKRIEVQGGATYLFQFDYQSPNAQNAGYVITLDDRTGTKLSRLIPVKDSGWHTYSQTITVPPDTRGLSLAVFAYSSADQAMFQVNRYDNFALQRVPDIQNRFYAVLKPMVELGEPKKIAYKNVGSTYKKVSVVGADKPFVLQMSEQYHPGWHIVPGVAAEGRNMYMAWKPQPALAVSNHLKVNGFENAWYIDPVEFCKTFPAACTANANGTYDMEFGVQFSAQRWFNFGMLLSGGVAVLCVGSLVFLVWRQRRRVRANERKG